MLRKLCRQPAGASVHYSALVSPIVSAVNATTVNSSPEQRNAFGRRYGQSMQVRLLSQRKAKTHYDILEVSENASSKDIKSAFYRLSMKLHPDRNTNKPDAAEAFKKVSEAYQVLSSAQNREEYDIKVLGLRRTHNRSRINVTTRTKGPPPTGRSHIYNFDEFYRQHYGMKVQRDVNLKQQYAEYEAKRDRETDGVRAPMWIVGGGLLLAVAVINRSILKPTTKTAGK